MDVRVVVDLELGFHGQLEHFSVKLGALIGERIEVVSIERVALALVVHDLELGQVVLIVISPDDGVAVASVAVSSQRALAGHFKEVVGSFFVVKFAWLLVVRGVALVWKFELPIALHDLVSVAALCSLNRLVVVCQATSAVPAVELEIVEGWLFVRL